MNELVFPCGCKFNTVDGDPKRIDISLNPWEPHSLHRLSTTCPAVWDMLGAGKTKGVFQLEKALGIRWSIKTKPRNIEDIAALVALLRPGCVSGDTKISTHLREDKSKKKKKDFSKITLRDLFNKFNNGSNKKILSVNEESHTIFSNLIDHVSYTGEKDVYKPKFKLVNRQYETSDRFYSLECTADHKLLVHNKGWIELQYIKIGDRVAVINSLKEKKTIGKSNFRDVCFQNYENKCVMCDWKDGTLDVNHIDGNRHIDNQKENLCFLCPNHHRMYTENNLEKDKLISEREKYILPNTNHIVWAEYIGSEHIGIKDVYDIGVFSKFHNFIAGNVVVHNCLRAMSGDPPKSMTQRYADRKMGKEEVTYLHKSIADVLSTTYGVLTYQEQAMRIAEEVAAFNKQDADVLRKAIGKKKADIMAKVEKEFLEKAEKAGIITLDEAKEIFGWIRESQKYSFNKSHAIAYGTDAYWSAYIKAHFPLSFYGAWILGANWKNDDKYEEIAELLNDAKLAGIDVRTPQLYSLTEQTSIINDEYVQFGLTEIKGVGNSTSKKVLIALDEVRLKLGKSEKDWTWMEFLLFATPKLGKSVVTGLISVGALDYMDKYPRNKRLYEYNQLLEQITNNEVLWLQAHWSNHNWPTFIEALKTLQPVRKLDKKVWVGGGGTSSVKREKLIGSVISLLENPPTKLIDTIEWTAVTEEHYLGTPITISKVDGCEESVEANTTCKEFLDGKDGFMVFAVEVVKVDELKTKAGKTPGAKMARLSIRDSSCTIDAVIFPKQWSEFGSAIHEGNTILMVGERTKDGGLSLKRAKEIS